MAAACMLSLLASCASPVARQRGVHIQVAAAPVLNPDHDGQSAPVMVRVYELAGADDFRQAGFFDLYEHDKQVLGKALLWRSILAVRPNQRVTLDPPPLPDARYLAVLVAYRDIYRARWRYVVDLPRKGDSAWLLTLHANRLSLEPLQHTAGAHAGIDMRNKEKHVLEQ